MVFRADAAFAKPEIYEALQERGVKYAIRIPSNDSLERDISELLTRRVGRPGHKPVFSTLTFALSSHFSGLAGHKHIACNTNSLKTPG